MSKSARLSLIAAIVCGGIAAPVVASKREVKEEIKLASKANDDNSTLDEGENVEFISPALRDAIAEQPENRHGRDGLLLTDAEKREIGRNLFKVKPQAAAEVEESLPEDLDIEGLCKWADEVAPVS